MIFQFKRSRRFLIPLLLSGPESECAIGLTVDRTIQFDGRFRLLVRVVSPLEPERDRRPGEAPRRKASFIRQCTNITGG